MVIIYKSNQLMFYYALIHVILVCFFFFWKFFDKELERIQQMEFAKIALIHYQIAKNVILHQIALIVPIIIILLERQAILNALYLVHQAFFLSS